MSNEKKLKGLLSNESRSLFEIFEDDQKNPYMVLNVSILIKKI